MRKKNYKGRCAKRYVAKCTDVCRTYDPLQTAYADVLAANPDIEEFRCNVYLDGLTDEDLYTQLNKELLEDDLIVPERKRIMYERFTMIAPILSFVDDSYTRSHVINIIANEY